jgi:hypothetical protein
LTEKFDNKWINYSWLLMFVPFCMAPLVSQGNLKIRGHGLEFNTAIIVLESEPFPQRFIVG